MEESAGVITLPNTGIYQVQYGVYAISNEHTDIVSLRLNGVEIGGTRRSLENNTMTGVAAIFQASAGSALNIEIASNRPIRFFDESNGIIGYLVITQLA